MNADTTDGARDATEAAPAVSETNWNPARTSAAVALLGTAGGIGLLAPSAGVTTGVAVAGAGAVALAAALWLLTVERWRVPATLAASLLLVPAGGAIAAGIGYELLVEFAASFPAATQTGVVGQTLRILGVAAVLWGCALAAFGAAASVRSVATAETLGRCWGLVVRTAALPVAAAVALAGRALVTELGVLPVDRMVAEGRSTVTDWLFAPAATEPALPSFAVVFAAASFATYRALRGLPTRELAGDATVGDWAVADLADGVERASVRVALVAFAALPVALLVGVAIPATVMRDALGPAAYGAFADLTTNSGLRHALVDLTLVAVAVAGAVRLVRGSVRTPTGELFARWTPYLAGAAVAAAAWLAREPALDGLLGFVAGRLDAPLADQFRRLSGDVVAFYGADTVVVGLVGVVSFLAACGVLALWLAFALGFVPSRVGGPALAGGGLFVAAAFAGTLDTPLWPVLAGLAVALVVWDAGEFATTLGAEVGRRAPTRRVELLHAVAAVAVGGVAVGAADVLAGAAPAADSLPVGGTALALVGAVGAVVLLVAALR